MRIEQSTYRIQPLSRVDKTRREKQEKSLAEIIVLEQIRKEIAERHKQDEPIIYREETAEERERLKFNQEMDSIGHIFGALAAILGIAVVAAQFAMWLGR